MLRLFLKLIEIQLNFYNILSKITVFSLKNITYYIVLLIFFVLF